jgi:hypothetical protein
LRLRQATPLRGAGPPSALELKPDLDQIEALSSERDALWKRLEGASFMTDDEKRAAAGYGLKGGASQPGRPFDDGTKFNPYHDELGRFTTADGDAGGSGAGGDIRVAQADDDPRKYSVNLKEEDARGGHAFRDHVGKSDAELIDVVQSSVIRGEFVTLYKDEQGSFLSVEAANDFTNQILQKNSARVDAVASGFADEAWLAERFGHITGKEAFRGGPEDQVYIRPTYAAGVLIRHDPRSPRGFMVQTAYPVNERSR